MQEKCTPMFNVYVLGLSLTITAVTPHTEQSGPLGLSES